MDRPILMSGDMVRAILEGRKTVTRRVVNPQPAVFNNAGVPDITCLTNRYGQPGDRLWVRETWRPVGVYPDNSDVHLEYRAGGATSVQTGAWPNYICSSPGDPWRPSIHMPRWASRMTLHVKDVTIKKVQSITDSDVRAEGVEQSQIDRWKQWLHPKDVHGKAFGELWDSINKKRGFGWASNPWVWVVRFKYAPQQEAE